MVVAISADALSAGSRSRVERATRLVDAVLSTATFHWVPEHERLFANLHAALKPGGRLVARCGGHGNVAEVKQAGFAAAPEQRFAAYFDGWRSDWTFATPEATERRLHGSGFTDVSCWLGRVDVDQGDAAGDLSAICLGSFLARFAAELREPFVAAALERLPDPLEIGFARLNILARRPETERRDGQRGDSRGPRR